MKGVCLCMSEKIYRLNGGGLLLYVRKDIPTRMKGVCFCMSEKIYRLNGGDLLLYVGEDIPTQ